MSSTYTSTTYDPTNMDINDPAYDAANTTYGTSTTDWDTSTSPTDYTSPDYSLSSTQPTSLVTNPTSSSNYNVGYNEGYNDALNTTSSTGRNQLGTSRYNDLTGSNLTGSNLASTYDDTTTYTSDDVRVNTGATGRGSLGSRTGLDAGLYSSQRGASSGWGQGGSYSSKPGTGGWKGAARRMASRF